MNSPLLTVVNKYLAVSLLCIAALAPLSASADTVARVRSSATLNLGYLPHAAPFSSIVNGEASGYAIELCGKIAEYVKAKINMPSLKVNYVEIRQGDGLKDVQQGNIDLLCTPGVETLAARESVSFSLPVFTAGLTAVVREDAPKDLLRVLSGEVAHTGPTWRATVNRGLSNHTYVVRKGGVTEEWVHERIKSLGVLAKVLTVESYADGLELIAQKKADAFFADRMVLLNYAAQSKSADALQVLNVLYDFAPISMALDRQDEDFRLIVDSALSRIYLSGEIVPLYIAYFGAPSDISSMLFKLYSRP